MDRTNSLERWFNPERAPSRRVRSGLAPLSSGGWLLNRARLGEFVFSDSNLRLWRRPSPRNCEAATVAIESAIEAGKNCGV